MRISGSLIISVLAIGFSTPAWAQFPVTTSTGARTLSSGTGTVTSAGTITTTGGTVGVTLSGTGTILSNAGTIQQTGSGRAIDNTANNGSLTVTNSGTISAVSTDAVRINGANTAISLTNSGTINVSAGGQAIDFASIATAANALTNTINGVISTVGDDAVRPGQNGTINNAGSIIATPTVSGGVASGSDGIDLRTEKNVGVTNSGLISGRSGIATDGANVGSSTLTVVNNAGGVIQGVNGSGLNVDANNALSPATGVVANVTNAFGATIKGGVLATTTAADGDGIDIDGILTLNNSGNVLGLGAKGGDSNAEAVSIGGGTIVNTATGRIVGSSSAADAPNGDTTRAGNGILADDSNLGNAFAATTINNSGLIEGKNGFGVKLIGTFANTVTNNAGGTIAGAGATSGAAIQTGNGADTLTNAGTITGNNGAAIDLQGGNDTLRIVGGVAAITGSISGGAGTNTILIDPGAGKSFAYANTISNFAVMEITSGIVTLSGSGNDVGIARLTGGALVLNGANRLLATTGLELNGGALGFLNSGGANGQTFASLSLQESSTIDLDSITSVTFDDLGSIIAGKSLAVLNWSDAVSPDYAIRFLGNWSTDSDFLALLGNTSINGQTAGFRFDGTYTDVTAVPEPASLAVLSTVLVGFVAVRRRKAVAA